MSFSRVLPFAGAVVLLSALILSGDTLAYSITADKTVVVGNVPGSGYVHKARNISGATVAEGAVVVLDATSSNADVYLSFTTTTTQDDSAVFGVVLNGPVLNGAVGEILTQGFADKVLVDGTTDIAVGDLLSTFTTAGIAAKANNSSGVFAIAQEAYTTNDSAGEIKAVILGSLAFRYAVGGDSVTVDGATGRSVTLLVAASDATAIELAQADYVCDGTADDVQIQAALDALPATGGTVALSSGTFTLAASVNLTDFDHLKLGATTITGAIDNLLYIEDASGVSITGINPDVSIINQTGVTGQDAVVWNITGTNVETHASMENVKVIGNASSGDGIRFDQGAASGAWDRVRLINVYSRDHGANGLEINPTMVDFTARNCWFRNNGENGVELTSTASITWTTVTFDKCYFMGNTEHSILNTDGGASAGLLTVTNSIFELDTLDAVSLESVSLFFAGNHMEGATGNSQLYLNNINGLITGNRISTAAIGIELASASCALSIVGNNITGMTSTGIDFGSSTGYVTVIGNYLASNGADYANSGSLAKFVTHDNTTTTTGIGIGIASAVQLLHISGDSDPTIRINAQTVNSANSGKVAFGETDAGADQAWVKYDGSANEMLIETVDVPGAWAVERTTGHLRAGGDVMVLLDVNSGITASTTQSQGQGALTAQVNEVSTVANANDTVTLPSAVTGMKVTIINNGVNTLQIFPASSDNLGAGVDTATTLASGANVTYVAYDTTNWESV